MPKSKPTNGQRSADPPTSESVAKKVKSKDSLCELTGNTGLQVSDRESRNIADTETFWKHVHHEISEGVEVTQTGGRLGSRRNCSGCTKNPGHKNFIRACDFKQSDCNKAWDPKKLPPYVDLVDIYDLIKTCIPLTVRLHSTYVSSERPDVYPLSGKRGTELTTTRNVGSGVVAGVYDRKDDWFGCETCRHRWRDVTQRRYFRLYECPDVKCGGVWQPRSEEEGKCPRPECESDSVEAERGIFQCRGDKGWCWLRYEKWKVAEDTEIGKCPWCGEQWWRVGEEGKCKCPKCGGTGKKGCVCDDCVDSGDRQGERWGIKIATARHVIYDVSELESSEVVFFDDGRDEPLELDVGKSGRVWRADTKGDRCQFYVYTHDSTLVEKLRKLRGDYIDVRDKIDKKRREFGYNRVGELERDKDLFHPGFLVGYPHGRHCHVTLGQMLEKRDFTSEYLIDSCAGNSGCLVSWRGGQFGGVFTSHSGVDRVKQVGKSSVTLVFLG